MRAILRCATIHNLLLLHLSTAALPAPFIGVGDYSNEAFQLMRVDYSNATSPFQPLGPALPAWLLVQGDATAYDGNGTYYAVLNAVVNGTVDYSATSLLAFDVHSGAIRWQYSGWPANYTMGALAWEPSWGLVGLCGSLLVDLKVEGFCGVNIVGGKRVPEMIADWHWTLSYDPDTRALDPSQHRYYHRLYNDSWMPDYFCTLDSRSGALQQFAQFSSPEFSGTRCDTKTGAIWSICNAPGGLDLCGVDPASGAFSPLGVFDRSHGDSELFAATAALDARNSLYVLTVFFASDGTHTRVVDIDSASPTYGEIVANVSAPQNPFVSNLHVLAEPDDV